MIIRAGRQHSRRRVSPISSACAPHLRRAATRRHGVRTAAAAADRPAQHGTLFGSPPPAAQRRRRRRGRHDLSPRAPPSDFMAHFSSNPLPVPRATRSSRSLSPPVFLRPRARLSQENVIIIYYMHCVFFHLLFFFLLYPRYDPLLSYRYYYYHYYCYNIYIRTCVGIYT